MGPADSDNDGVADEWYSELDKCPGSEMPEAVPTDYLKPNHWAAQSVQNLSDTFGCTCEQILFCKPGANTGEFKFGCSPGTMAVWEAQVGWSADCQTAGVVDTEGEEKDVDDTDGDTIVDSTDVDDDNDGTSDANDSETESAPNDGKPDWWCAKHPTKC